jgi:hypothetical protein
VISFYSETKKKGTFSTLCYARNSAIATKAAVLVLLKNIFSGVYYGTSTATHVQNRHTHPTEADIAFLGFWLGEERRASAGLEKPFRIDFWGAGGIAHRELGKGRGWVKFFQFANGSLTVRNF